MHTRFLRALVPALLLVLAGCPDPSGDSGGEDPELRGTVSVNGSPSVGGTLTADTSLLEEGAGVISYRWIQGDSTVIAGAAGESYTPGADDAGKTIKVEVSRAGYRGTLESEPVGPVTAAAAGGSFNYTLHNTVKYFSLAQGKEVLAAKSNTNEWDIAIQVDGGGFCYVYTNSGASAEALGTTGQGGVWFTNETNFNNVTLASRVTDYTGENAQYADCAAYETDVTRYQMGMSASLGGRMNIMTYYGYASGDGLTADTAFGYSTPGPPSHPFYEFNKKAFAYVTGGMPPPWHPTQQIYIIRHADGVSYSKFQVTALRYQTGFTYVLGFRFANLQE
jgi:hypothetical protein